MSDVKELAQHIAEAQGELIATRLIEWLSNGNTVVLPEYLDTKRAAAFVSFSVKAFEHHRHHGVGPRAIRIGQKFRYAVADLRAWMEQHRVPEAEQPEGKSHWDQLVQDRLQEQHRLPAAEQMKVLRGRAK